MVEDSFKNKQNKKINRLTEKELSVFQNWKRPLQKALTLEAESGFINVEGRKENFNEFIARELKKAPDFLGAEQTTKLIQFANVFKDYQLHDESARRRRVIDLRQLLHRVSSSCASNPTLKPPYLKVENQLFENVSASDNNYLNFDSPVAEIPGIGEKLEAKLSSIGISFVNDFFHYYPRDYVDYSCLKRINELVEGQTSTVVATVRRCSSFISPKNTNLAILDIHIQDITGRLKVTKFFAGRRFSKFAYLKSQERLYPLGSTIAVSGLVKESSFGKSFTDPIIEVLDNPTSNLRSKAIGRLLPIYSLAEGITADRFRGFYELILPLLKSCPDPIPKKIIKSLSLFDKGKALFLIHSPCNQESLKNARRRLVFDEFFAFQLGLLLRRSALKKKSAPAIANTNNQIGLAGLFLSSLPFPLTNAQRRVLHEIEIDLNKIEPMSRLLQGDVGSGKTVVATTALLNAVEAGWQGALMAPTEVLAEQHYRNLCKWLPQIHVTVDLLTGSTTRARRRELLDNLANGTLKILVGTHALLEEPVTFLRLGLVVVDEQHRFGVRQRNLLLNKGLQPHLLTMTATPIPRTLALSLHGDLDVSQIDELPPGRTPVDTRLFTRQQIDKVYDLIREEVRRGQQAYFVLPLVDDSQKLSLRSAIKVHNELSNDIFPDLQIGLLHGRLNGNEKQLVIQKFLSKEFQILVSTTVVEVGVDVPNATVMVIDNADRFGLSQLHQLRGRVGRGALKSHCALIYDGHQRSSKHRLEVLSSTTDGFEISEIDLRLRGPGQVLGTKQSGLPDFALASLIDDAEVLELARTQAKQLLQEDPDLTNHISLRNWINQHSDFFTLTPHLN